MDRLRRETIPVYSRSRRGAGLITSLAHGFLLSLQPAAKTGIRGEIRDHERDDDGHADRN
jgi:hypothetical protein